MSSLLQSVSELHAAELYDDLKLYVSLKLEDHVLDNELDEGQQALLHKLVADAFYHTDCFYQSTKLYERALEIVRRLPRNSYPQTICQSELRYSIYKALIRERKYEDAVKVLSLIPKNEHTPKTRAALAKLLTNRTPKQSKNEIAACHSFVLSHFPCTALYSYNELLNSLPGKKDLKEIGDDNLAIATFFKARMLVIELKPLQAITVLKNYNQSNARIILELAILYNFVGNRSRAIAELERLRSVDPFGVQGMDLLASLYYANHLTNKTSKELESLVHYLHDFHPNAIETFMALSYLLKLQNQQKEAYMFVQRALILAEPGRTRTNAALLRALILIENKNYDAADQLLQSILSLDTQNIDAFELSLRANLQRRAFETAKSTGQLCRKSFGKENPRSNFIYAQSIFNQPSMKAECEKCLQNLVEKSPYLTDAVVLLAKHYDRENNYSSEAISRLKQAANSNLNPIIKTVIEEMQSKCRKTTDLSLNLRQSILNQTDAADSVVLHSLNSTPTFASTPDCSASNVVPNARGIQGAPRRQRTNAVRQPAVRRPGTEIVQRLNFTDSMELDALRDDLVPESFHSPDRIFAGEVDEDIDVGSNGSILQR